MDKQRTFSKEQIRKIIAKTSKIQGRRDILGSNSPCSGTLYTLFRKR